MSQDQLAALKVQADELGLSYHPSIGYEKLKERIEAHLADDDGAQGTGDDETPVMAQAATPAPVEETPGMKRKRLKDDALALVRVRITCMNPAKKDWEGEIITCGNASVGTVRKYIPFNAEEGWHVPKIMYEVLKNRMCTHFVTEKTANGVAVKKWKQIREFAIEVLPMLTEEELHDLAQRQAMAKSVG